MLDVELASPLFMSIAHGLLTFIALELMLFAATRSVAFFRKKFDASNSGGKFSSSNAHSSRQAESTRLLVELFAPDLVDAIHRLQRRPSRPEGRLRQPSSPEDPGGRGRSGGGSSGAQVTSSPTAIAPVSKPFASDIGLILVNRVGSKEDRTRIGWLRRSDESNENLYSLEIKARLPRALIQEIADRVGVGQSLDVKLSRNGPNHEDPLSFTLSIQALVVDLSNPQISELEFSVGLLPLGGLGRQLPDLQVDFRSKPTTVLITARI